MSTCTLTFYNDLEDGFGVITARPNPEGEFKAIQGVTIAVAPNDIPFKSRVKIPALRDISKDKDGVFYAHDTGSAVRLKTASILRGNSYPVIDVFMKVPKQDLPKLNDKYGEEVEYEIL